ncbi:PIN domain-containing protein [Corynebacterium riegelii]|uniref:PIN domain-containing protein n=1 Tax=Corynebacterium riegelii TaxID=156976 RepID=UPI00255055D1|nr:PIN domain-containing protein [Corynebacterium riegelii]
MTQRVFVDANVLFSKTCRDWLYFLRQENEDMFQLCSTNDVMVEVLYHLRKRRPKAGSALLEAHFNQIRDLIDEVVEVFPGHAQFTGRDNGDYHVHAAAIACQADVLLTNNSPADFTDNEDAEPYEIYTADDFFVLVADSNPASILRVTKEQFEYWGNKPGSQPLDKALIAAGCPQFAARVRENLRKIALM